MINKQFHQEQSFQKQGIPPGNYSYDINIYKDTPVIDKIMTRNNFKNQKLNKDFNLNSSNEQFNNYFETKSSVNKRNTVNSDNNTRNHSKQQLLDQSMITTSNPESRLQNIHINQPYANSQFRNSHSKSQMGQRLKMILQENSTRNSVNLNAPIKDNSSQNKLDIVNYQSQTNNLYTNQTIQKRIQTINDEIAKQRQYLPQFKNLKPIDKLSESNFNFFQKNSQPILVNKINQMGSSPQVEKQNLKPNALSRGGASTTDQSFYQAGSPKNLKKKLWIFQNQKQAQIDNILKQQNQESLEQKKQSLKQQGLNNQQINSILKMQEQGQNQQMNKLFHDSVIKDLRNRANGRPDIDTFNNGHNLQNLTHNLGQGSRMFPREYIDSSLEFQNNRSDLKVDEINSAHLTATKKKRRAINYQIKTSTKDLSHIELNHLMVKSANNFTQNKQLEDIQENKILMYTTATPILIKKNDSNIESKINNLNQNSQQNLLNSQNYSSQKKNVMINDEKQIRNVQSNKKNKIKVYEDDNAIKSLINAKIDKDQDFKKISSFEYNKKLYDSNIKISEIHKINLFSDQEKILQNLEKRKQLKTSMNDNIFSKVESSAEKQDYNKQLEQFPSKQQKLRNLNQTSKLELSLPQIQKQKTTQKLQPIQDKRLSLGMPTSQQNLQSQIQKNVINLKTKQNNEFSTQRKKNEQPQKEPKIKETQKMKYKRASKEKQQDHSHRSIQKLNGSKQKSSQRRVNLSTKKSKLDYTTDEQEYINNIEIPLAHQKVRVRSQNQRNFNNSSMAHTQIKVSGLDQDVLNIQRQQSLSPSKIKRSKKSVSQTSIFDIKKSVVSMKKIKIKSKQKNIKNKKNSQSYSDRQVSNFRESVRRKENNLYDFDPKYFKKIKPDPPLFIADVDQNDYEHLMNDDLDEISKLEVSYKILKQQLREQQKKLIELKEERQRQIEQEKLMKKKKKRLISPIDLSRFARHIKHFELYGSQRDLSPELKRIVKNLMCQEHKFMYCPKCKIYEAQQEIVDPIENIQKFMNYIKKEQEKLRRTKRLQNQSFNTNKPKKQRRHELLPDDSASDITYLEEQEILSKYYDINMTEVQRKKKERTITQQRLYGQSQKEEPQPEHVCKVQTKKKKPKEIANKIKVEFRAVEDPQSMHDESNSAHQFSQYDISVQADSEARCDMEMQTSAIDFKSVVNQTSKQDHQSIVQQTSEIEYRSNNMQTSLFGPNAQRAEFSCQTDPKMTTQKLIHKQKQMQTQRLIDVTKDDWANSSVYKKAMRNEAKLRNLKYNQLNISTDDYDENENDETTQFQDKSKINFKDGAVQDDRFNMQNAQDPDTDITIAIERQQLQQHSGLGFLKNYWEKGNIQILTQTELQYVKQLLKQKNHELWQQTTTLNDLQRHCKFTIRKLTQQMANLDNSTVFRNLKQPSRKQTLYLVYRAELLFQAHQESEKIFKLFSKALFDREKFRNINQQESTLKEDFKFIIERETLFKRIMTQVNSFTQTYKLFQEIIFEGQPFIDYLQTQIQKVIKCKQQLQEMKQNIQNEQNQYNDSKNENINPLIDIQNQRQESINQNEQSQNEKSLTATNQDEQTVINHFENGILQIFSNESLEMNLIRFDEDDINKSSEVQQLKQIKMMANGTAKRQLSLKFNKDNEQDLVGKNTIDVINQQLESFEDFNGNKSDDDVMKYHEQSLLD